MNFDNGGFAPVFPYPKSVSPWNAWQSLHNHDTRIPSSHVLCDDCHLYYNGALGACPECR